MCRLVSYQGPALVVSDLLYRPSHSLIEQSYQAREIAEPLNGDGFGLGWYSPEISHEPAVFAAVTPAWNNRNLRYMTPKLVSPTILAHVRAATVGDVTELNCHPFHYRDMLMMQNGGVADFHIIKRALVDRLSAQRYHWISGQTDSEHLFALFLDHYMAAGEDSARAMAAALEKTFRELAALKAEYGLQQPSWLNMVVTNGRVTAASRYADHGAAALSLHYTEGSRFVCADGNCRMRPAQAHEQAVLIASEPLTDEHDHWHDVPVNHFALVDENQQVQFRVVNA